MNHLVKSMLCLLFGALALSSAAFADSRSGDIKRIRDAQEVFHELMETPDKAIPRELLESAKCIAIVPGQKRAAFLVGAEFGRGLAMCRTKQDWSGPVFFTIAGGGFGLQVGGASVDVVLVFRNREGFQRLLSDKFTIGADATAAAGPIGRNIAAATDAEMHAEILTYSRSRGIFAGVSLQGAVVKPDRKADEALYGKNADRQSVLNGNVPVPEPAESLIAEIRRSTQEDKSARKTSGS